jgi:hypothetical protein
MLMFVAQLTSFANVYHIWQRLLLLERMEKEAWLSWLLLLRLLMDNQAKWPTVHPKEPLLL